MTPENEILVLADDRASNRSQAIGLAQELGFSYQIIDISYSFLAKLPNFILKSSLFRLKKQGRAQINSLKTIPKIIISAGRKTAPIALNLKKKSQQKSKVIQIMNPDLPYKNFDFIILPEHDQVKTPAPNIITSLGALTKINQDEITKQCQKFPEFATKTTKIALLLGGDSKNGKFLPKSAQNLVKMALKIAENMGAELLILTSRRTGAKITEITQKQLKNAKIPTKFYDYQKLQQNPYLAIAFFADFFIITGDSVSMISEICSMAKPVYIYDDANLSGKKHKIFHKSLHFQNFVRKLDSNVKKLQKFNEKKLDETKRIADIIKKNV